MIACQFFAHMKDDQIDSGKCDPRDVYANPIDYKVYPVLTLAIYLLVYAPSSNEIKSNLFFGSSRM